MADEKPAGLILLIFLKVILQEVQVLKAVMFALKEIYTYDQTGETMSGGNARTTDQIQDMSFR